MDSTGVRRVAHSHERLTQEFLTQTKFVRYLQPEQSVKALTALANVLLATMSIVPLTIVPDSFKSTPSASELGSSSDYQPKAALKTAYGVFWMLTIFCNLLALFMAITLLTYAVTAPNILHLMGNSPDDKFNSCVRNFVPLPYCLTVLGIVFLSVALAITAEAFYGLGVCILAVVLCVAAAILYLCLVCAHQHYVYHFESLYDEQAAQG